MEVRGFLSGAHCHVQIALEPLNVLSIFAQVMDWFLDGQAILGRQICMGLLGWRVRYTSCFAENCTDAETCAGNFPKYKGDL